MANNQDRRALLRYAEGLGYTVMKTPGGHRRFQFPNLATAIGEVGLVVCRSGPDLSRVEHQRRKSLTTTSLSLRTGRSKSRSILGF
jgi:hypothetical protein